MGAKLRYPGLEELEPELAKSSENGALLIDCLHLRMQIQPSVRARRYRRGAYFRSLTFFITTS